MLIIRRGTAVGCSATASGRVPETSRGKSGKSKFRLDARVLKVLHTRNIPGVLHRAVPCALQHANHKEHAQVNISVATAIYKPGTDPGHRQINFFPVDLQLMSLIPRKSMAIVDIKTAQDHVHTRR